MLNRDLQGCQPPRSLPTLENRSSLPDPRDLGPSRPQAARKTTIDRLAAPFDDLPKLTAKLRVRKYGVVQRYHATAVKVASSRTASPPDKLIVNRST